MTHSNKTILIMTDAKTLKGLTRENNFFFYSNTPFVCYTESNPKGLIYINGLLTILYLKFLMFSTTAWCIILVFNS